MAQEKGENLTVLGLLRKVSIKNPDLCREEKNVRIFITLRTFINSIGIFLDKSESIDISA